VNDQSETIVISTEERAIFQSLAGQVIACALQNALTIIIVVSDMAKGLHSLKLEEILKKELQTTQCQGLGFAGFCSVVNTSSCRRFSPMPLTLTGHEIK